MKRLPLAALVLALLPQFARGDSYTITDNNSTLKFTRDEPTANLGTPGDPLQLARKIEWTVDGRRIVVYPSSPATFVDIGHIHPGAHVRANQLHAQGPMLDHATGPTSGDVTGGFVYSVDGGAAGSGTSRISEKVDIHNKTGAAVSVLLAGMGFKPTQASLEVPDLSGLEVTGTTLIYVQGNTQASSLTEPPFAPVTVLPVVSFSGFNPLLNQSYNLPGGAYLTMVTELKVTRAPAALSITVLWWLIAVIVLSAGAALIWRQRSRRG